MGQKILEPPNPKVGLLEIIGLQVPEFTIEKRSQNAYSR